MTSNDRLWPRLLKHGEAAAYLGVGRTKLYELTSGRRPQIPYVVIGSDRRYDRKVLDRWVDALSEPNLPAYLLADAA